MANPGARPRWLIPLVTATAVLAVGSSTALAVRVVGHHDPTPTAAPGQAGPAGGLRPSGTATSSATPAGTPTNSAGSTPSDPGKVIRVGTLSLTVPTRWRELIRDVRSARTMLCLGGTDAGCDLWVTTQSEIGYLDVDLFGSMLTNREPPLCSGSGAAGVASTTTTAYRGAKLGQRPAEYRAYERSCDRTYEMEQWTVPTWPPAQVTSTDERPELRGQVRAIVASARFSEPDSGRRVTDKGVLTGHSTSGGVVHVRLDRTIWISGGVNNGHDENSNHTTYDYRLSPAVTVTDSGQLCSDALSQSSRSCPLATLLARIDQGKAGIVHLDFDRQGEVLGIQGEYRP
jgi:hypothetical protein